jgi:hypothetical protein
MSEQDTGTDRGDEPNDDAEEEPEQRNPGGQARPDREDRPYHDGV